MSPLDLERLAVRIERLQRTRTHGWDGGDSMSLRNLLPGGRGRQVLPDPQWLRDVVLGMKTKLAEEEDLETVRREWRNWLAWAQRAEGYIQDNDPRNPRKMMRDMARGKLPRF